MSDTPAPARGAPPVARAPRRALVLAVVLSAVPLLALSRAELIGYDGYWHVFVAGQDDWRTLWAEIRNNAHPPLFSLCLRAAIATFGANSLAYRLVSIAAALGSAWLVGRIVERTARHPWLPAAAAFAFGSSLTTAAIGLEVRPYALSLLFMLWAALALLDLARGGFAEPGRGKRVVFALATSLALLSHYGAVVFLAGAWAAAAAAVLVDRDVRDRLRRAGRRRWLANLLAFAVPSAVFAVEYAVHVASWTGRFHHVSTFLFDARRERALAFVWRNTRALFELFVPPLDYQPFASTLIVTGPKLSAAAAGILALACLAAVGWLGFRPARGGGAAIARRIPALVLLAMAAVLIVLALARRYPYGGPLRHQALLFPFAVVVLALLVDEFGARTGRRTAALAVGLFALASALNTVNWVTHFRITRGYLQQAQVDRFREVLPAPETIYVDQYNLITVFTHHHDRQWRFVRSLPAAGPVDVWRVGGAGPGAFWVCRDNQQWQLDLAHPATYRRMLRCLAATGGERVAVFRPQQKGATANWPLARTADAMAAAAAPAGLVLETLDLGGEDVYAALARRRDDRSAQPPAGGAPRLRTVAP